MRSIIMATVIATISAVMSIIWVIMCFEKSHWFWFIAIPHIAWTSMWVWMAYQEYNNHTKGDE